MKGHTPEAVLREMGACGIWVERVKGKSWAQAFTLLRDAPTEALWWLWDRLRPPSALGEKEFYFTCGDQQCCPGASPLLLREWPQEMWLEALRAEGVLT